MADQQRQDSISCYPGSAAITPNIDSIAADGILFTNSWTSTPSCTPARAAILTGRSPWGHGMLGYGSIGLEYDYELVSPLNEANYLTASIGKNHFGFLTGLGVWAPATHGYQHYMLYDGLGDGFPPFMSGENHDFNAEYKYMTNMRKTHNKDPYNEYDPEQPYNQNIGEPFYCNGDAYDDYDQYFQTLYPGDNPEATGEPYMDWNSWRGAPFIYNTSLHPTYWVGTQAMDWLDEYAMNETEEPFFLKISFHRPHSPYDPPQSYIDFVENFYNLSVIHDIIHGDLWDAKYINTEWCGEHFVDAWCGWMEERQTKTSRTAYYANVKFIDDMVGEILTKLKDLGLYDSSYILWTADHGDQLGDHNLWRKTYPYNSNAKIPMIIKWPSNDANTTFNVKDVKLKRGTVDNQHIVELRDLLPTFHNVSGIELPNGWQTEWSGLNMNCLLYNDGDTNDQCEWREILDLEHSTCYNKSNHWNALTDGITYKYIFNAYENSEQLFNLSSDPNEKIDIAPLAQWDGQIAEVLTEWRTKMVRMFEKQDRGPTFVKYGRLQQRLSGQTYGPNYPQNPAPCQ